MPEPNNTPKTKNIEPQQRLDIDPSLYRTRHVSRTRSLGNQKGSTNRAAQTRPIPSAEGKGCAYPIPGGCDQKVAAGESYCQPHLNQNEKDRQTEQERLDRQQRCRQQQRERDDKHRRQQRVAAGYCEIPGCGSPLHGTRRCLTHRLDESLKDAERKRCRGTRISSPTYDELKANENAGQRTTDEQRRIIDLKSVEELTAARTKSFKLYGNKYDPLFVTAINERNGTDGMPDYPTLTQHADGTTITNEQRRQGIDLNELAELVTTAATLSMWCRKCGVKGIDDAQHVPPLSSFLPGEWNGTIEGYCSACNKGDAWYKTRIWHPDHPVIGSQTGSTFSGTYQFALTNQQPQTFWVATRRRGRPKMRSLLNRKEGV